MWRGAVERKKIKKKMRRGKGDQRERFRTRKERSCKKKLWKGSKLLRGGPMEARKRGENYTIRLSQKKHEILISGKSGGRGKKIGATG